MPQLRPLAFLLVFGPLPATPSAPDVHEGWRLASTLELGAARAAFLSVPQPSREARLGAALARLHEPPVTRARADEARAALDRLVAETRDDAPGIAGRYHLARLQQDYLEPADPAEAARLYAALHAEHPGSAYGQHAFIKLVLLRLAAAAPADRAAVLAAAEPEGAALPSADARRAWHLVMAVAHLQLDPRSADALRHALAADAIPGGQSVTVVDNLLRVAELAADLGRPSLAADYYARFAAARPRDARAAYARDRIAALTAASSAE